MGRRPHVKHRLNVNVTYQLPFGDGRKWLNGGGLASALLGGWQLAMSGRYQVGSRWACRSRATRACLAAVSGPMWFRASR